MLRQTSSVRKANKCLECRSDLEIGAASPIRQSYVERVSRIDSCLFVHCILSQLCSDSETRLCSCRYPSCRDSLGRLTKSNELISDSFDEVVVEQSQRTMSGCVARDQSGRFALETLGYSLPFTETLGSNGINHVILRLRPQPLPS
jgi:hypothetical protein